MYVCMYIYAVKLSQGPSLAILKVIWGAKLVFYKHHLSKNTIKWGGGGFSHLFLKTKSRAPKILKVFWEAKLACLCCTQLGLWKNLYLAPQITFKNVIFLPFLLLKKCSNTFFIVFYGKQPNIGKNWPRKKTITFQILKIEVIKKNRLLQPPCWPKIGVFELVFFET